MKDENMELVFILDKSGSMAGLESDTIGGFNSLLKKQRKQEGNVFVTTVLFNDKYSKLHERVPIKKVSSLTRKDYIVGGTTALLDAIGVSIHNLIKLKKSEEKKENFKKVLFVIITDGRENSSREYSYKDVKKLISFQKEKYNWEFLFLGANIDAAKMANQVGIRKERATNYHADKKGTELNYNVLSETVSDLRRNDKINDNWKNCIEEDYENRKE